MRFSEAVARSLPTRWLPGDEVREAFGATCASADELKKRRSPPVNYAA